MSFRIARIVKLHYITYTNEYLVKHMIQDSKNGLLHLGLELSFLRLISLNIWGENLH